jgi:hypothetical protein
MICFDVKAYHKIGSSITVAYIKQLPGPIDEPEEMGQSGNRRSKGTDQKNREVLYTLTYTIG